MAAKRLQKQMEFYLSSSNILKDKYLQQNMDEEGYISLELFLNFNKLKQLNVTLQKLQQAVSKSRQLLLSEDSMYVARSEPVELASDTDILERTIYVEGYDAKNMDHDSLRKLFTTYGKVLHVSMPRFKNHTFRGFAFLEFEKKEAAEQAATLHTTMKVWLKSKWLQLRNEKLQDLETRGKSNNTDSINYIPDLVLKLRGVPASFTRAEVKNLMPNSPPIAFVDDRFLNGPEGNVYIRYLSKTHAVMARDAFNNNDMSITCEILKEKTEQDSYWKDVFKF